MMFYGNGGRSPWMLALVVSGMLLFWGSVICGSIALVRGSRSDGSGAAPSEPGQVLNERLARGEISVEEYERLRKLIGSTS
jgi:putative membrane protein